MHSPFIKFIALFLLLAQSWLGLARGQSVCIQLDPCEQHAPSCEHAAHSEHAGHTHDARDHQEVACGDEHAHGFVDPQKHQHTDCGCHLHVSVPSFELAHGGRALDVDLDVDADSALPALTCCVASAWPCFIALAVEATQIVPRPPDRAGIAIRSELLGLRATELLL